MTLSCTCSLAILRLLTVWRFLALGYRYPVSWKGNLDMVRAQLCVWSVWYILWHGSEQVSVLWLLACECLDCKLTWLCSITGKLPCSYHIPNILKLKPNIRRLRSIDYCLGYNKSFSVGRCAAYGFFFWLGWNVVINLFYMPGMSLHFRILCIPGFIVVIRRDYWRGIHHWLLGTEIHTGNWNCDHCPGRHN